MAFNSRTELTFSPPFFLVKSPLSLSCTPLSNKPSTTSLWRIIIVAHCEMELKLILWNQGSVTWNTPHLHHPCHTTSHNLGSWAQCLWHATSSFWLPSPNIPFSLLPTYLNYIHFLKPITDVTILPPTWSTCKAQPLHFFNAPCESCLFNFSDPTQDSS